MVDRRIKLGFGAILARACQSGVAGQLRRSLLGCKLAAHPSGLQPGRGYGYLDRILRAGFSGVYLDKIDSNIEPIAASRPTAAEDMRALVTRIAEHGRKRQPGFLVVPQNGEELLSNAEYRRIIDGLGKEDLLYGEVTDKVENPPETVSLRLEALRPLLGEPKPVFAVEYLDDPVKIEAARRRLVEAGLVPHFADRALDRLRIGDLPLPIPTERR